MMTSDDKVGGWVKKGQNHDEVILECPHTLSAVRTVALEFNPIPTGHGPISPYMSVT